MRDFIDLIADLADALPRREPVTERTVALYQKHLADIDLPTLEAAVEELINTSDYFPTIRAIRETAAELRLALPREDEALTQVEDRISWRQRPEETRGTAPPLHPAVREALDHVGGFFAFRAAEKPDVVRGQFLRLYREIRAAKVRAAQTGRAQPQLGAA